MPSRFHCGKHPVFLSFCILLLAGLLCSCGQTPEGETTSPESTAAVSVPETVAATIPADGNPDDITCKGSYTGDAAEEAQQAVVATVGGLELTNGQLQAYYWMEVAAWQAAGHDVSPDFDLPLDTQVCELDDTATTWQQYFLQRALNTYHSAQALVLQGDAEGLPTEEAYQPNKENHEIYLTDKPATSVLYGYNEGFTPNELHQAYLDEIPSLLEELAAEYGFSDADALAQGAAGTTAEALTAYTELYNRGYMYFTNLSYYISVTDEEVAAYFEENRDAFAEAGITEASGKYVDIRQILVLSSSESDASAAQEVLDTYYANLEKNKHVLQKTTADAIFAELANKQSQDESTALDGGLYQQLRKGQLIDELDQWVFDDSRQSGDVTLIHTDIGGHILFYRGSQDIWYAEAEQALTAEKMADLIAAAREAYPMTVDYSAIELGTVDTLCVTPDDLLYPDVAHQRYPVVQLYLQQDYPTTMYGAYKITSHGCGITTMAMLATYMTDTELTPPTLCPIYEGYCFRSGTDGSLFTNAPAELGFYLKEKTFDWREAYAAMEEGYLVVVVQQKGYWTRGGHYLVLEKLNEEGLVQVRDSNIYNYGKLHGHADDLFSFSTVTPAGMCYWIYDYKITAIPACSRCGDHEVSDTSILSEDYICEKCAPAILRRESYLTACTDSF